MQDNHFEKKRTSDKICKVCGRHFNWRKKWEKG
ncbi:TPA: DUF2256 domain-containing protein [Yersinia enterocolitica]|nr:DUF2256 domain-containing protein [Yersinia enterocolitica]HDL7808483.1 DUF2256 domain-containing protein [Yersinia enterocolitica]